MLENKLTVGTLIDGLNTATGRGSVLAGEVSYDVRSYSCGDAASPKAAEVLGAKVLPVSEGDGANGFVFLPWVEDAVNYTQSQGKDVLSGPFTGCLMTAYTRGGSRRIGHVSTPSCNALWDLMKKDSEVKVIAEFKPSDAKFDSKSITNGLAVFGLVTADGRCYSVVCDRDRMKASWYKVVSVVKM
jgi:hypothetical protein